MSDHRRQLAISLLILPLILSGCTHISCHTTVLRNGSATLNVTLRLPHAAFRLLSPELVQAELRTLLEQQGFELSIVQSEQETTVTAWRQFEQAADMLNMLAPTVTTGNEPAALQITNGLLFDHYRVRVNLDLHSWLTERFSGWQLYLSNLALSSTVIDLQVTLPWTPKEHNADVTKDGGRTLCWQIPYDQPCRLQLLLSVPNGSAWAVIAGAMALTGGIAWRLGRRRRK